MPNRLLATKFHAPAWRPGSVARPRLVERLQAGLAAGRQLTLIAAPAGYGKTTLAAEWLHALAGRLPVAWLSLDEADDDPLRFCAYFLAALQTAAPAVGAELTPVLAAGQLPPPKVLSAMILNDLAAALMNRPEGFGAPLLCVLDDFHCIQDGTILAILQRLLAHPAAGLHLALVTREDPALPLARLRARGQLTEVRAADLRFTPAEAAAFLRDGMGLALADSDLGRLVERTEGWAAGLQLAGLSMQGRPDPAAFVETFSGSHRFILSYLTEEVLARQPADVQEFLLQTSILAQLNGDLCDAVTGRGDSAILLERLFAANLFLIAQDDEGCWYRYHRLFAELLQGQLRRGSPERTAELHRRASQWYAAHDLPAAAIDHALAAGDHPQVVVLLEEHAWALLNRGYARKLEDWFGALPPQWRTHSLRLSLDFGWMRLLRGAMDQVEPLLAQAEAALAAGAPAGQAAWEAECLALRANWLQAGGRNTEAIAAAGRVLAVAAPDDQRVLGLANLALGGAYRQLPDFDRAVAALQGALRASRAAGDRVTEMLATAHLTLMATQYGRLRLAASIATETIQRLEGAQAAPPIAGAVYGALGQVYIEWNDLQRAREQLQRGIRLSTLTGHNASAIYSLCHLARILQAEGDLAAAGRTLDEAAALLAQGAPGWVRPELIARQAGLALARGDEAATEAHLRASGVGLDDPIGDRTDALHLAWLRLLLARGDPRAGDLAQRIIASAEAGSRHSTLIQALLLAARLEEAAPRRAVAHLQRALALAEPEGYVRVFLDEGEAMRLRIADWQIRIERESDSGSQPDTQRLLAYARQLYAAFGEPSPASAPTSAIPSPQSAILVEPLSKRELEVLRLLAEGLSYAEIAGRLVVSLNTVRFHVKEIYSKLGVNRQAQAVARARELGLM